MLVGIRRSPYACLRGIGMLLIASSPTALILTRS